jgi:hypothetical protein
MINLNYKDSINYQIMLLEDNSLSKSDNLKLKSLKMPNLKDTRDKHY